MTMVHLFGPIKSIYEVIEALRKSRLYKRLGGSNCYGQRRYLYILSLSWRHLVYSLNAGTAG